MAVQRREPVSGQFRRPSIELIDGYRGLGSATVGEAMGGRNIMCADIRAVFPGCSVVGPATTCLVEPFDNLSMHMALQLARPGDVLVIATRQQGSTGLWGGLATTSAVARGVAGVVAAGGVRDIIDIKTAGFPVWASSITPRGAQKALFGSVNAAVSCGGVVVAPGDLVVGDEDGVAVVPAAEIESVLAAAEARAEKERALRVLLSEGATPFELLGLKSVVEALGIEMEPTDLPTVTE